MTGPHPQIDASTIEVDAGTISVINQARRLGLVWNLNPATVTSHQADVMNVPVSVDGSPAGIARAVSLIGTLAQDARVMLMEIPPQGNYIIGRYGASGQWQEWTPTFANLTVGDGSVEAWYRLNNGALDFHLLFQLGASSAVGTDPTFMLPYPLHASYFPAGGFPKIGSGSAGNPGVADFDLTVRPGLTGSADPDILGWFVLGANDVHAGVSATSPFVFGTGDSLAAFGAGLQIA